MTSWPAKNEKFPDPDRQEMVEYRLVVHPDQEMQQKIQAEKKRLFAQYGLSLNQTGKMHISVAHFFAKEEMEETLIRWIHKICSRQRGFWVTLNNFSGFPPHSIYLRVQDPTPFEQLALQFKSMDEFISLQAGDRPHLGFAAKLPGPVFEKAMRHYAHQQFHDSFEVTHLLLIKKEQPETYCKTVNVFHFLPNNQLHAEN